MKRNSYWLNEKSQPSFIEKFGIISSFVFSLIALLISIINYKVEKSERIIVLDAYESNYIFDGEDLYKNICFAIANNSDINTSIIEINIKIDGEDYSFNSVDNSICPININSNETVKTNINIPILIDEVDKEFILNKYGVNYNIDVFELEFYLKNGEDMQNIYNIAYNPRIEIKLKSSKGNEIKFYKEGYFETENFRKYISYETIRSLEAFTEMLGE